MADMNQIQNWIIDEAYQSMPLGYSCKLGTKQDILERTKIKQYRNRRFAYDEIMYRPYLRFLHKFHLWRTYVETFIYNRCDKTGEMFYSDLIGECLYKEADNVDMILIFPDKIPPFFNLLRKDLEEDEEMIVRGFVKHEVRHAKQFVELRRIGVDPVLALNAESTFFDYPDGPLEEDAYYMQIHGKEKRPVHEVAREMKELLLEKGVI